MDQIRANLRTLGSEGSSHRIKVQVLNLLKSQVAVVRSINDKDASEIVDILCHEVRVDRDTWIDRNKINVRPHVKQRLHLCAMVVRDLITSIIGQGKFKLLRRFLYHALDVLPDPTDVLLSAIANSYLHLIRLILARQQHLDHADQSLIQELSSFCLNSLEQYQRLIAMSANADLTDINVNINTTALWNCLGSLSSRLTEPRGKQFVKQFLDVSETYIGLYHKEHSIYNVLFIIYERLKASYAQYLHLSQQACQVCLKLSIFLLDSRIVQVKLHLLKCFDVCRNLLKLSSITQATVDLLRLLSSKLVCLHVELSTKLGIDMILDFLESDLFSRSAGAGAASPVDIVTGTQENSFILELNKQTACLLHLTDTTYVELQHPRKRRWDGPSVLNLLDTAFEVDSAEQQLSSLQLIFRSLELELLLCLPERSLVQCLQALRCRDIAVQNWARLVIGSIFGNSTEVLSSGQNLKNHLLANWTSNCHSMTLPSTCRASCYSLRKCLCNMDACYDSAARLYLSLKSSQSELGPSLFNITSCAFMDALVDILISISVTDEAEAQEVLRQWLQVTWHKIGSSGKVALSSAWLVTLRLLCDKDSYSSNLFRPRPIISKEIVCLLNSIKEVREYSSDDVCTFREVEPLRSCHISAVLHSFSRARVSEWLDAIPDNLAVLELSVKEQIFWTGICVVTVMISRRSDPSSIALQPRQLEDLEKLLQRMARLASETSKLLAVEAAHCHILLVLLSAILSKGPVQNMQPRHLDLISKVLNSIPQHNQADMKDEIGTIKEESDVVDTLTPGIDADSCHAEVLSACTMISSALQQDFTIVRSLLDTRAFERPSRLSLRSLRMWILTLAEKSSTDYPAAIAYFAKNIVSSYQTERAYQLHELVLEILKRDPQWWIDGCSDTQSLLNKLFQWLIDIAFDQDLCTAQVRINLALLSNAILARNKNYTVGSSSRNAVTLLRTKLIERLLDRELSVCIVAIDGLLESFVQLPVCEHQDLYETILDVLPINFDDVDRLRVRIVFLTEVVIRLESIRAIALYHLIEIVRLPVELVGSLHQAVIAITKALDTNSKMLFMIHRQFLLYMWLKHDNGQGLFPFHLFLDPGQSIELLVKESRVEMLSFAILLNRTTDQMQLVDLMHEEMSQAMLFSLTVSLSSMSAVMAAGSEHFTKCEDGQEGEEAEDFRKAVEKTMKTLCPMVPQVHLHDWLLDAFLSWHISERALRLLATRPKEAWCADVLEAWRALKMETDIIRLPTQLGTKCFLGLLRYVTWSRDLTTRLLLGTMQELEVLSAALRNEQSVSICCKKLIFLLYYACPATLTKEVLNLVLTGMSALTQRSKRPYSLVFHRVLCHLGIRYHESLHDSSTQYRFLVNVLYLSVTMPHDLEVSSSIEFCLRAMMSHDAESIRPWIQACSWPKEQFNEKDMVSLRSLIRLARTVFDNAPSKDHHTHGTFLEMLQLWLAPVLLPSEAARDLFFIISNKGILRNRALDRLSKLICGSNFLESNLIIQEHQSAQSRPLERALTSFNSQLLTVLKSCLRTSHIAQLNIAQSLYAYFNRDSTSMHAFSELDVDESKLFRYRAALDSSSQGITSAVIQSAYRDLLQYVPEHDKLKILCTVPQALVDLKMSLLPILTYGVITKRLGSENDAAILFVNHLLTRMLSGSEHEPDNRVMLCAISIIQLLWHAQYRHDLGTEFHMGLKRILKIDLLEAASLCAEKDLFYPATFLIQLYFIGDEKSSKHSLSTVQTQLFCDCEEPDAYSGISRSASLTTLLELADRERSSYKRMQLIPVLDQANGNSSKISAKQAFANTFVETGLDQLNIERIAGREEAITEAEYISAWRLGHWTLAVPTKDTSPHALLYRCYQSLWRHGPTGFNEWLEKPILPSHVSSQAVVSAALLELFELIKHVEKGVTLQKLCNRWTARSSRIAATFSSDERNVLFAARQTSLQLTRTWDLKDLSLDATILSLLVTDYTVIADSEEFLLACQAAARCEAALRNTRTAPDSAAATTRIKAQILVAKIMRKTLSPDMAVQYLLSSLTELVPTTTALSRAELLLELGISSTKARASRASAVLKDYLEPAIQGLQGTTSASDPQAPKFLLCFASFCDNQAGLLNDDPEICRVVDARDQKALELEVLQQLISSTRKTALKQQYIQRKNNLHMLYEQDVTECQIHNSTKESYLHHAFEAFLRVLALSDLADLSIYRCINMWFSNDHDIALTSSMRAHQRTIPTHKFLAVISQLIARMKSDKSEFHDVLSNIVRETAQNHPYHCIGKLYVSKATKSSSGKLRQLAIERTLHDQTWTEDKRTIMSNIFSMCLHYEQLACLKFAKSDYPSKYVPLDAYSEHQRFVGDFCNHHLPPLTYQLPVDETLCYMQLPVIVQYNKEMGIAGGISAPKVLTCRLSDGKQYKELVKSGNDDLRQDLVMQQVFRYVNQLFATDRGSRIRQLRIRSYGVLPLSSTAGVLEWVMHTAPLQEYLTPLHTIYRQGDWSYNKCRKHIVESAKKPRDARIAAFHTVTKHCRPAMRHAFFSECSTAISWYNAQLLYTRSTAVMSIIGHILGLGDRHLHNILIDVARGEIVHIDLGIAFEQGKLLPIPETVPFRLTRDIVDGMGIMGVEGVFRRCCEITLSLLRNERTGVHAILDVLRNDPLYSWTLNPLRREDLIVTSSAEQSTTKPKKQDQAGHENPPEAARALAVVHRKLTDELSLQATVNTLIIEATDTENLALLFAGWSAWY